MISQDMAIRDDGSSLVVRSPTRVHVFGGKEGPFSYHATRSLVCKQNENGETETSWLFEYDDGRRKYMPVSETDATPPIPDRYSVLMPKPSPQPRRKRPQQRRTKARRRLAPLKKVESECACEAGIISITEIAKALTCCHCSLSRQWSSLFKMLD